MTKKERAEFDALLEKARILGALRWTERVERDLPPPTGSGSTSGWRSYSYGDGSVEQSWSDSFAHGRGPKRTREISGSQGGISLHSTKLRALKALRHEVEMESAKKLARIDKMSAALDMYEALTEARDCVLDCLNAESNQRHSRAERADYYAGLLAQVDAALAKAAP